MVDRHIGKHRQQLRRMPGSSAGSSLRSHVTCQRTNDFEHLADGRPASQRVHHFLSRVALPFQFLHHVLEQSELVGANAEAVFENNNIQIQLYPYDPLMVHSTPAHSPASPRYYITAAVRR